MDEFIENFQKFKVFLNNYWPEYETTPKEAVDIIRDKFEELGLNQAF